MTADYTPFSVYVRQLYEEPQNEHSGKAPEGA